MTRLQRLRLHQHREGLAYCMKMLDTLTGEESINHFLKRAIGHEAAIAQLTKEI